jgi:HAD superfamily hydrolase (TIGR01509 family)
MPLRLLIFDLDGTLVDSSDGVVEAVNYSLEQVGATPQSAPAIKRFIGDPLEVMYPHFTDAPFDVLHNHFQERARHSVSQQSFTLDGVDACLRQLRDEGYQMAVASTKISAHIDSILTKHNWHTLFDLIVGSDQVARVKPDPEIFRKVLDELKGTAEQSLVIGDTHNDVIAAKRIPMQVVAVESDFGCPTLLTESSPDYRIGSLSELPALIHRLNGK